MKLHEARDLKNALVTALESSPAVASYALALGHAGAPRPLAAIGVSPRAPELGEYGVAVRIFDGAAAAEPAIHALLGSAAPDADVARVRYEPRQWVRAGASVGHRRVTAGTIGAFVKDGLERRYVLSNNHVLANNDACAMGDEILSPGPADAGPDARTIARLALWKPLFAAGSFDAAIAELEAEIVADPLDYGELGRIELPPVADRYEPRHVVKRGRTTGATRGLVSAFDLDGVAIDYGVPGVPRIVTFDGSIEIVGATDPVREPFSDAGDSGSLVICADTMRPYALLYGGGRDESGVDRTLCHFLPPVLEWFGVEIRP